MISELASALPLLIPKAIAWAEQSSSEIYATGVPLLGDGIKLAKRVGVKNPEKIRISHVSSLPLPSDPLLRQASLETGLLGPNMIGLTLGHAIYICHNHKTTRLLSHEFRHVHQYEQAGSISLYLPQYLQQIVQYGYLDAPYEIDARAHEIDI
jgi:hypothetical protein